ncbi:hypothetical protein [Halalkalirubrum salinum]|uniref:hypothetical protein n=1 Tax=Halalkalirubrum salinum TaxID=2563889 RepID=UPI0010FB5772|nr:hypothetical protein [Halalkalirubrum salinum]
MKKTTQEITLSITELELIATYDPVSDVDPREAVAQYRRVMKYTHRHPDKGSSAVSTAVELPRGRIRSWVDSGGKPDAVRAIETAASLGWLDATEIDRQIAFATLLAGIFSGGSIAERNFNPSWSTDDETVDTFIEKALTDLGCGFTVRHEDSDTRSTEIVPAEYTSLLGRVLVAMGAPIGSKVEDTLSIPDRLVEAADPVRERFVEIYLRNRIGIVDGRNAASILEDRPSSFRRELAALCRSVGVEAHNRDRYVVVTLDSIPFAIETY